MWFLRIVDASCPLGTITPMLDLLPMLVGVWAGFLGASIASFLVVVGERIVVKESIGGRSHCICGRQLSVLENIPIASYLALMGKARCCRARIPLWYLLAELSMAFAWSFAALAVSDLAAIAVGVLSALVVLGISYQRARLASAPN